MMSSSTLNDEDSDIEQGLVASPPPARNPAGTLPLASSSTRGNLSPAVVLWTGITPFATAPIAADDDDAAGVRTGSAATDAGTTPSSGPEHVNDNEGLPPPPGHIEAILDGPSAASASAAVMPPSLCDPPLPPGLVAALIKVAFDEPEVSRGLKTTGLCPDDYLDECFDEEAGEEAVCTDDYFNEPYVTTIDEEVAAERGTQAPGLNTTELYGTQDPDGPPSLFHKMADGEAADSSLEKSAIAAKTPGPPTEEEREALVQATMRETIADQSRREAGGEAQGALSAADWVISRSLEQVRGAGGDGDDAPAPLVPTEAEDGNAIDPHEDQAGPLRRYNHDNAISSPQADHANREPNSGGPRQLPIRPPPPSMLPRPDDDDSSNPSPPPPLLSSEPSMLMLEATLVQEMPVYNGVRVPDAVVQVPDEVLQVPDEEQGSCWRRYNKFITGAMGVLLIGLAVAVGTLLSSNSNANNDERIVFVGFGRPSIQPSHSSQATQSAAPSQSSRPSGIPSDHPTFVPSAIPSSPPSGIPSLRPSSVPSTVSSSFQSSILSSSGQPSSSFQPSTTYKCFVDRSELKSAVDQYMYQWCQSNEGCEVGKTYGWPMNSWCLSDITDMHELFNEMQAQFNEDLSSWDVSSVTDMHGMFSGASSFNGNVSSWDVSSVANMEDMFYYTLSFDRDISSWDVSSVTNMDGMFHYASSFNGDVSSWDVSSVANMRSMFQYASFFNGDVSSWNVSSVTDMYYMFYGASSFNSDIRSWDVSSVTSRNNMFTYAISFDDDNSPWNT